MKDTINNLQRSDTWKIQVTIVIDFIFSNDNDEDRVMHAKTDNIEIMTCDKAIKVIEKLFDSPYSRYRIRLKTSMKGSDFIFDYVNLLYYKCQKINLNCGRSYIYYPDWIKNKMLFLMINVFNTLQRSH